MLNNTDLETEPKLDLDRRFKRCVLEACYVSVAGQEVTASFRKAVANNILALLTEIDAKDFDKFQESFSRE